MSTTFHNIPFDFLAVWSKKHTSDYPALTYINTLRKSPFCVLAGDVYSPLLKTSKKLNELRAVLTSLIPDLEAAYEEASKVVVLPSTPGLSPSDSVKEFITEYADHLDILAGKMENHHVARESRAKIFRSYTIPGGVVTTGLRDMDYVATVMGISRERVRQILSDLNGDCRKIFLGETVGCVRADSNLVSWFRDLDSKLASAMPLSSFRSITGMDGRDPYSERFIMDILGIVISSSKGREQFVSRGNLAFARDMGKVIKFFRDCAIPVEFSDFEVFLKKTFKNEWIRRNMRDYVLHSDDYEVTQVADGSRTVALKWENLEFFPSETARILFDMNAFEVKDAVSRTDLINEYNTRARLYRKDTMSVNVPGISRHPLVMALGKSGYYKIQKFGETFDDGLEFARKYVCDRKDESSAQEFLDICKDEGYLRIYGERSMSTFFYMCMQPLSKKAEDSSSAPSFSSAEILKSAALELEKAGEAGLRVSELWRRVCSSLGPVPFPSFRVLVGKAADNLLTLTPGRKRRLTVSLLPIDIASFDFEQFNPRSREAAYRSVVVATAVDELRRADGHKMQLMSLVKILKGLLPSEIAPNNVYKVFADSEVFVKTSVGNKKGDVYVELNHDNYSELYEKTATAAQPSVSAVSPAPAVNDVYSISFDWSSLRSILCGQFRTAVSGPGMKIGDVIDEMYVILSGKNKSVEEGTEEYKILSLLNNYYTGKTSPQDRELLAIKLVLGLEPYLKSYYRKISGNELYNVKGLGTIIRELQDCCYLPTEVDGTNLGRGLSNMTENIIVRRNKVHTNFEGFSGCSEVNSTLGMFLKYYVLAAAYELYYVD